MKLRTSLLTFTIFLAFNGLFSQNGTIRGKVLDSENAEPMIGATVRILQDSILKGGAYTDLDGKFNIANVAEGIYTMVISYVSYKETRVLDLVVKPGQVTNQDYLLAPDYGDSEKNTVTITSKVATNTDVSILNIQRRSSNVMDGISSQQFKRTGDANAASAMARVTGVSIEGGKYVYVRGLGDRYSKTLLNGAVIPGLDPERNAVQMDMFPSNLIDNIQIYKTFTPDLPGDFTGGLVKVMTKDFPEKYTFQWSSAIGYNPQSSFKKNFLTGKTGKTDWLGFDDGTRGIPRELADGVPFQNTGNAEASAEINTDSKAFSTSIYPTTKTSGINHNHSISAGNQWMIKNRPLGFIASLSYRSTYNQYTGGQSNREKFIGLGDASTPIQSFTDNKSSEEVLLGGLINLSYKPWDNHKFSFNYLRNQSGESFARYLSGKLDDDPALTFETRAVGYLQRSLDAFQLKADHIFPKAKNLKIDWIASYTLSRQSEPDLRFFSNDFIVQNGENNYDIQANLYKRPSRYFRKMKENNLDLRLNFELPFKQWSSMDSKIKFGGALTQKDRTFGENRFEFLDPTNEIFNGYNGNPADLFNETHLGVTGTDEFGNAQYGLIVQDATDLRNSYSGSQVIGAGYGMIEMPLIKNLKTIAGVRYEVTNIKAGSMDPLEDRADIVKHDILPSFTLIFQPIEKINLRGSYTRTVARPTFRELAPFTSFNFVRDNREVGNPALQRSLIDNVDLRLEFYPSPSEVLSISGFYKNFNDPIERVFNTQSAGSTPEITWRNVGQATLFGGEIEFRKSLGFITPRLKDLRIGGNACIIKSIVNIDAQELELKREFDPNWSSNRPMFAQSPFTINAEIAYSNDSIGFSTSLNFNIFGARIAATSSNSPDIYEQPRPRLDFFASQRFAKSWMVTLRARNLLNPAYLKTQKFPAKTLIYESYTVGQTFSLGLSFTID